MFINLVINTVIQYVYVTKDHNMLSKKQSIRSVAC